MLQEFNKVRGFELGDLTVFLIQVNGEFILKTLLVDGELFDFENHNHLQTVFNTAIDNGGTDGEDPLTELVNLCLTIK